MALEKKVVPVLCLKIGKAGTTDIQNGDRSTFFDQNHISCHIFHSAVCIFYSMLQPAVFFRPAGFFRQHHGHLLLG
ncbi:hypothetical protein B1H10_05595 [candidate division KSB1 bacterium 4484_188]|nr:MAG: hypothetical protein B1H10_05595 [candidate division KSB1 bacterium 4484_188]